MRCDGVLHSARFRRKPRGGPAGLGEDFNQRLSFCCAVELCRKRLTPPSFRFLGRKAYLGAVVVLISAMREGATAARRLSELAEVGLLWRQVAATIMPPIAPGRLPASLLERFAAIRLAWSSRYCGSPPEHGSPCPGNLIRRAILQAD
jgi:hypothetical protein